MEWIIVGVLVVSLFIAFAVYHDLQKRQENMRKELEKLKYRNTALETQQLKFALQPHTLNNILANIKAMSNQISRSMESLSAILEYIFYHGEDHFASIEDEIEFIKSYLKLQDAFTKEINNVQLDLSLLDENNQNYCKQVLPHLITAYLVENAFKHGDINHPEFLKISIELSENIFVIQVTNKIRRNYNPERTGIGLSNMKSRLKHLKEGKHQFSSDLIGEDYFVKLEINLK
jgi:LytS/YehU family sensor histidine kinase